MLLLAAYPVYLFTRAVAAGSGLRRAGLRSTCPPGPTYEHTDAASGSRWCIDQCRFRTPYLGVGAPPEETQRAYATALRDAGWRPRTEGFCPAGRRRAADLLEAGRVRHGHVGAGADL